MTFHRFFHYNIVKIDKNGCELRISKIFNEEVNVPLVLKTLANDEGSVSALGTTTAEHLSAAKAYFSDPKSPPPDPDSKEYRAFALPLLDALAKKTDPSFTPAETGKNHLADHFDWILKVYADAALSPEPIKSEDLRKIPNEINLFNRIKNKLAFRELKSDLHSYTTYKEFTDIVRPYMSQKNILNTVENAPDNILAETTILYDGEEGSIVVPHTHNASKYFGSPNWCICYDDTDEHFNEDYNLKSPIVMYLPHDIVPRGEIMSGKVSVVDNEIYDENDDTIYSIPDYVVSLRNAALREAPSGIQKYLKIFGDVHFDDTDTTEEKPKPEHEHPIENRWPHLADLPKEQQDLLIPLNDLFRDHDNAYKTLFKENPDLANNKKFMLAAIKQDAYVFLLAGNELKNDKDLALAAIIQNEHILLHLNENLKKDQEFILSASKQNSKVLAQALKFGDKTLKSNKNFMLSAVTQSGLALQYADDDLKKDKDVVLAAVTQDGSALQYADDSHKKDKDVALAAVTQNGSALQYADTSFKKDKDVVLAAVTQDGLALQYANHSGLIKDYGIDEYKKIVLAAIKQNEEAMEYAHNRLQKNKKFLLHAVQVNGLVFTHLDDDFGFDQDLLIPAILQNGLLLADIDVGDDTELPLLATEQNIDALDFVDDKLFQDDEFLDGLLDIAQKTDSQNQCKIFQNIVERSDFRTSGTNSLLENKKFANFLLDIAGDSDPQNKRKVLGLVHRIPALFGHISADIADMRVHLRTQIEPANAPDLEHGLLEATL